MRPNEEVTTVRYDKAETALREKGIYLNRGKYDMSENAVHENEINVAPMR